MSQVMSPLGALLLNTTAANPSTSPTGSNNGDEHQMLKLMSVGLLNESSRALNFHHSLALTLATANCRPNPKMTFKSTISTTPSRSPTSEDQAGLLRDIHHHHHHQRDYQNRPDSTGSPSDTTTNSSTFIDHDHPEEFHSPNSSPIHSHNNITRMSQNNINNDNGSRAMMINDEDEVLSIGRDDDQVLLDCDSSLMSEDESTTHNSKDLEARMHKSDNEIDNSGSDELISSPSPSPVTRENNNFLKGRSRDRNYSSEDCSSVKYLPLPFSFGLSEAILKQNSRQQSLNHHQASLNFSIANILREDFGAGKLPGTMAIKPNLHMHSHSSAGPRPRKHHNLNHVQGSTMLPMNANSSTKRSSKGTSSTLQNKIPRKHEPVIPIDLSRPTANGSPIPLPPLPLPNGRHKSSGPSNHHRKSGSQRENESSKSSSTFPPASPTPTTGNKNSSNNNGNNADLWPAWVYCTRYSDRPSSGPRSRRGRKKEKEIDEKRPRTAFTTEQLGRLKKEFDDNKYLTEKRRQDLAKDLRLHENQIKIWFQNKRAKLKKSTGQRGKLALELMAQGLYNHSTIQGKGLGDDDEDSDE